ncbi:MAG: acetyl-CoA C-acyltransferase [Gemmatimonadaceae bacterium]|jgi:acetyl-CoA acyltransferase|nr:acetyl-CoA C-acyltransferase [Gemmatimonadaceae bacterium]
MTSYRGTPRVAIIAGLRTPFAKAGTAFKGLTALDLGRHVVAELMQRTALDGREVDQLVWGTVLPTPLAPNPAREIALLPHFPRDLPAHTVGRACASANQAITDAADQIALGHSVCAIAGGAESLSQVPILHSRGMSDLLIAVSKARTVAQRVGLIGSLRPRDFVPVTPAIAEPSTGESMGQSAEKMAKLNGITREAQDAWALRSHRNAATATSDGHLAQEIAPLPVPPDYAQVLLTDNGVRAESTLEALAALPPVFDKRYGSVTAGNASPLTDGAAAVLLMREDTARALGYAPIGYIRAYANAAIDPAEQLLQAPVLAAPKALERAGITARDLDVIEIHEAFAAQVLSNLQGFASQAWADRAGAATPLGELDPERINHTGGSIAIGHPFGATGARVVTTCCHALARADGQFGMVSVCAAGGMGHVMIIERA